MHFSAASCVCGSRNRVIAPATTPCCWRRRRRRVRAIAWSISAPASAPPALRSPGASPGSSWCWSRSMPSSRGLRAATPPPMRSRPMSIVLDVTSGADAFAAAGLPPDSVDVVLMNPPFNDAARHRASPDRAREIAHVATAATLESWIHAGAADSEIRRRPHADLARRWPRRGAGGARSRLWQPRDPAGPWRRGDAGDPRAGSRHQGRQGADRKSTPR